MVGLQDGLAGSDATAWRAPSDDLSARSSKHVREECVAAAKAVASRGVLAELSAEIDAVAAAGRLDEALERRAELVERLEMAGPTGRPLLVSTLFKQAATLSRVGDLASAVHTLRECVERFSDVVVPERPYFVADALWLICRYNFQAGRFGEAVAAADALAADFGGVDEVADRVADALLTKARSLSADRLRRPDEQLAALAQIVDEFAASENLRARRYAALALFDTAALADARGQRDDALAVWGRLFSDFKDSPPERAPALPFRAQVLRIDRLARAGRLPEARNAAVDLVQSLQQAEPAVRGHIAQALLPAAKVLEAGGDLTFPLGLYRSAAAVLLSSQEPELQQSGVLAKINISVLLMLLGDVDEATATTEEIVALGEPALAALDAIIRAAQTPDSELPPEREPWALLMRGLVLRRLGQSPEARTTLTDLVARFHSASDPIVSLLVERARQELESPEP
jgi:tetratricopeptide (TPR) repeat protein